jgi:hypothetical protein
MGSSSYLSTLHVYSYSFVENKRKNLWDKKVLHMGQKSLTYGTFKLDVLLVHVLH